MTIPQGCIEAFLRAVIVSCSAVMAAFPARNWLAWSFQRRKLIPWVLILTPLFIPPLLAGYAFSNTTHFLIHYPACKELLYMLILFLKFIPAVLLVYTFAPQRTPAESIHCRNLLCTGPRMKLWNRIWFRISSVFRTNIHLAASAAGIVFLLVLAEFEIASLLGITTWTVSVFDSQAGGMAVKDTLYLSVIPVVLETAAVLAVLYIIYRGRSVPGTEGGRTLPAGKGARVWGYIVFGSSFIAVAVFPFGYIISDAVKGMASFIQKPALIGEICVSTLFAGCSAYIAYKLSGCLISEKTRIFRFIRLIPACLLCMPGLLGPLVLGLAVLNIFLLPILHGMYNSPVPLFVLLVVYLLPYAVLLNLLHHNPGFIRSLFIARLSGKGTDKNLKKKSSSLVRVLKIRWSFWVLFLLFWLGYIEVQGAVMLSPPGMTPVFVRLYNLMHYGRSNVLSSMVVVSVLFPAAILAVSRLIVSIHIKSICNAVEY